MAWHLMGRYVEPVPGSQPNPCLPPDTDYGRNLAGNVYEAHVGLYWLEDNFQGLTDISPTLMDLDQIEDAQWSAPTKKSSTGFQLGALALKCQRFAFVYGGRCHGYLNGKPSPSAGAVAEPRLSWIQDPGNDLFIPEWQKGYDQFSQVLGILKPRIFEPKFRNNCATKLIGALRKSTSFVSEFAWLKLQI